MGCLPWGTTFTICVNMLVQEFSEKGAFFIVRLRSDRSEESVSFLADLGNKGTFFMTIFIVWSHIIWIFFSKSILLSMVLENCSCYYSENKGVILIFILVTNHAQILNFK